MVLSCEMHCFYVVWDTNGMYLKQRRGSCSLQCFAEKSDQIKREAGQNSQIVGSELCCFNWETNLHHSFLCCRKQHSSPSPLFPLLIPHCTYVNICLHNDFFILSKNDGSLFYWLHFFPSIILDKCEDPTFSRWIFES